MLRWCGAETKERTCDRHQHLRASVACRDGLPGDLPLQTKGAAEARGIRGAEDVSALREDHASRGSRLPGMRRDPDELAAMSFIDQSSCTESDRLSLQTRSRTMEEINVSDLSRKGR